MLRIRLKRLGRKKQPFYRIIVTEARTRRQSAPIEELGTYDPRHKELDMDKAKALDWITKGATATETVQKLIEHCGEDGKFTKEAKELRQNRKAKLKEAKKQKEAASSSDSAEAVSA